MTIGRTAAATVFVDVEGDLTKFKSDIAGAGGIAEKQLGGNFGRAAKIGGTALAGASAAAIGGSVTAFVGFERSLNEVFTLIPDAGQGAYDELTKQTKDFAKEFGVLPDEVVPALYDSLSAGVPPDNVFEFLEEANKFAKAGAVDLGTSVDGLTSTLNAYGMGADETGRVSDALFTAVKLGKTTVDELSASMFQVAPIAASFGVSIEDVAAGFATLTAQGTPTSVAATQMKGAISELGKEGTKASDAFKEITGKSFTDFIAEGGSLVEAADWMAEGAHDLGVNVVDLFGSIEAGQAFVGLSADMNDSYDKLEQVQNGAGATQVAFEQMEQGIGPAMDKLKARFAVVALELGTTLAPTVETVGLAVAGFAGFLADLPGPVLAIIVGVAGLTGGLLALSGPILRTTQIVKGLSATLSANPYILLIAATVALAYIIYKNWDEIKAFLLGIWETLKGAASGAWAWISEVVGVATSAISGFINDYIVRPVQWVIDLFAGLPDKATAAFDGIKTAVVKVKTTIVNALNEIRDAAANALGPIGDVLGKASSIGGGILGSIPGFDTGGIVPGPRGAPRLILAHGGETVLPTHKNPAAGIGAGMIVQGPLIGSATISNDLDIEHVARELDRRIDRARRAQGVTR